jgi:hypothetical protein
VVRPDSEFVPNGPKFYSRRTSLIIFGWRPRHLNRSSRCEAELVTLRNYLAAFLDSLPETQQRHGDLMTLVRGLTRLFARDVNLSWIRHREQDNALDDEAGGLFAKVPDLDEAMGEIVP